MKLFYLFFYLNLILSVFYILNIQARSIFRPKDSLMPEIITKWLGNNKTYYFRDSHLEEEAIFKKFNYKYFMSHSLPLGPIKYRNNLSKSINGTELSRLTEELISELYQYKNSYKNFDILKNNDFNKRIVSGNLVLKFKDYPFVLKLFIENPESFVKPFSKGWQPACFFLMSGGINRYLSGFTRIKNLEVIKEKISQNPEYASKIDFPRKWFWLPKNVRWFELAGKNIGVHEQKIYLPSIYGIFADAINKDKKQELFKDNPYFGLELSYYLDNRLDPHIENFMLEKETGKIVIVDTEHFPSMVGLKNKVKFSSYTDWYVKLSLKCLKDRLTRHKIFRRSIQTKPILTIPL